MRCLKLFHLLTRTLLMTYSLMTFANSDTSLTQQQLDSMNCEQAFAALQVRIGLSLQLGDTYIETFKNVADLHSTWASQFRKKISEEDQLQLANIHENQAKLSRDAIEISKKEVATLKDATNQLNDKVKLCIK